MTEKLEELREGIAEIEHKQWQSWAKSLIPELNDILYKLPEGGNEAESLFKRLTRWATMLVPYDELPNEVKDQDRNWADQILFYLAEKGACFPVSKEDRDKMSDPMANYEIVITLKEMIKDGS